MALDEFEAKARTAQFKKTLPEVKDVRVKRSGVIKFNRMILKLDVEGRTFYKELLISDLDDAPAESDFYVKEELGEYRKILNGKGKADKHFVKSQITAKVDFEHNFPKNIDWNKIENAVRRMSKKSMETETILEKLREFEPESCLE